MRLSFDWLCDFVDLSGIRPEEVAERLTMGAFEVEEVVRVGPDIDGPVVVGEIIEINPHPNADKIRLTRVKVDQESDPLEIVCGASNIIVGQKIPVALNGARVINRHDGTALHIKPTKIRGVQSNGMLCSPGELGITSGESEGILVLYGMPKLGADVKKLLHLVPDHVFHVEPRSNRGDALSVTGMAREVAALFDREFVQPIFELPHEDKTSELVQIHIENQEDCPYFSMRIVQGVHVKESPLTLTRRLEAIGVRPVNNVVDVTNYVLHETGQPLHAYDLAKLKGPVMEVRRGRKGEILTTLDDRQRQVNEETLCIADSQKLVGIAGIMGGKESEITEETTFIALEAAAFRPARVRRGGRLLGLSSDSSLRFERGVDAASVHLSSDRATYLLLTNCGGMLGRFTEAGDNRIKPVTVNLRLSRVKKLLEVDLSAKQVGDLLSPLGFKSSAKDHDTLSIEVPSFRQKDVGREIDLIEEVCRRHGYDRIPISMPKTTTAPERKDPIIDLIIDTLCASGLSEAYISSLVRPEPDEQGNCPALDQVTVLNPLSEDHQALRQSLLPGLIKAVAYNHDRGQKDVWLFEIGRSYRKVQSSSPKDTGVVEEHLVAGVMTGNRLLSKWQNTSEDSVKLDFFASKGIVQNLLDRLSIPANQVQFTKGEVPRSFHPGLSTSVEFKDSKQHIKFGTLGQLHPAIADEHGLRQPLYMFEFKLSSLAKGRRQRRFEEIYSTPCVVRDLTVDISKDVEQQVLMSFISQSAGENLQAVDLISVFELPDNQQSLSYRLTFQHKELTLTAEEIDQSLLNIRDTLSKNLKASFRA